MRDHGISEERYVRHLVDHLRDELPYLVTQRHEDKLSAGIPDISITRRLKEGMPSIVVWLEAKVYPGAKLKGLQHERLVKLGGFYIVWDNVMGSTSIYAPRRRELAFGDAVLLHSFELYPVSDFLRNLVVIW